MKEIKITEIENIRIGSAENKEAGTGCTVIICERGAAAGYGQLYVPRTYGRAGISNGGAPGTEPFL